MASLNTESTKSQRESVPNNDISIDDCPRNLSIQKAETELASSSQVDDLGNGKHLEQQEYSDDSTSSATPPSQEPAEFLVAEAGTGLRREDNHQPMQDALDTLETQPSSIGYDESLLLDSGVRVTQVTTSSVGSGSLGDELREAYCETASKQRSDFLPIDALDRIVTEDRVREEIEKIATGSYDDSDRDVKHILDASTNPGQKTSRKKIFAILALLDKSGAIWDFVKEGIYDIHLPFEKERADGSRKNRLELTRRSDTGDSTRIPITAFHGWTGAEVTHFERTQWDVHIPIFFLNTEKHPRVRHYTLQESVVLPFIEDDEVKQGGKMGGFADVWRVKFHPSHHNHGVLASGRSQNPSFAIKRLRYMDETAFRKEVQNLKRFSTKDHLHLIKLLGTYEWRRQYYLIFPWADGNLLDFWERHEEPLARKRDTSAILWFSEQCLELVKGIKMIHTWDTPDGDGQQNVFSFPTHQTHGMHGDLKPENILWFKQYAGNTEQSSSSLGHFKISDFGLSHFHETKSIADIDARDIGFSPTYRAPERDIKGKVTQSYDIWSLACVLLEFASWYLGGYDEVKTFVQKRVNEDTQYDGGYKQDRFFNFMRASQDMPDNSQGIAHILAVQKASVAKEFDRLYDNPCCSDYMVDFLELVQKNLLRLGPENRKGCTEIVDGLQKLHDNLQKDPGYGTIRVKQAPSRSPTLDSVLMEGDVPAEFKKQIRKSLPRRSFSFDRETAHHSTSLSAAISSSTSPNRVNTFPSMGLDSRPTSPERKAKARLSTGTDLTTVQELPASQSHEELETAQHSQQDTKAAANKISAHTEKCRELSTVVATGLNIMDGAASQLKPREGQHRRPSDAENTQQTRMIDSIAVEVASDPGSDRHEASNDNIPPKSGCATDGEEPTNIGDGKASQNITIVATYLEAGGVTKPTPAAQGPEGENHSSPSGMSRDAGAVEHLEVPRDGGDARQSSESPTLNASDAGQEEVPNRRPRARNSSQIGSQGREKMTKHTYTSAESVVEEDGEAESGCFMTFLKKIPCFN